MSKVAFCFPGQGSLHEGMGREIAEAFPAAMEVYELGSEATGMDLARLSFEAPARGAGRDGGPAADARRDVPRDPRRARERGAPPRRRRRPLRRRVRGARGRAGDRNRRGDRARARAWSRDGRRRAAAAGSDGGDPRARGRAGRDALPEDPGRVAGELQLPGADRDLGRERRRRRVLRRGGEPRGAPGDQAQGVGRVPQPSGGARGRRPQADDRADPVPRPGRAVHVDGDGAHRARQPAGSAARRPAHRAGALHAVGDRARPRRRHDLRRGRAGHRALGARQADRPIRPHDLRQRSREPREGEGGVCRAA